MKSLNSVLYYPQRLGAPPRAVVSQLRLMVVAPLGAPPGGRGIARALLSCMQIFESTTCEEDGGLEPSPDRPFAVRGLDPQQRPIRPRRFADRETAQHVAKVLCAVGYSVSVIWCLGRTTMSWCLGRTSTTGGAQLV